MSENELEIFKKFYQECFDDPGFFVRCPSGDNSEECALLEDSEKPNCARCLLEAIKLQLKDRS